MRISLGLPQTGHVTGDDVRSFAERAERLGAYRLWTHHRLLYPVQQAGAHPSLSSDPEDEWPASFRSVHDPVVPLAVAGAVTSSIGLGIGVINTLFYAPVVLAKMLASLDVLSAGRLAVGLGLGWSPEELQCVGVAPEERRARFDEWYAILRGCWNDEVVAHNGTYYTVPPSVVAPKPLREHGPELLGAGLHRSSAQRAMDDVGSYIAPSVTIDRFGELVAPIPSAERGAVVGRLPVGVHVAVDAEAAVENVVASVLDQIAQYRRFGIGELIIDFNFWPALQGRPQPWQFAQDIAAHVLVEAR